MVQQCNLSVLRISFLVAGHTKFAPDLLFSTISQSYNRSDVFTTEELKQVVSTHATVVVDDGHIVCDWRDKLTKYTKLPGICSLHDFIFVKNASNNTVVAKVRKTCFSGPYEETTMHIASGRDVSEDIIPDPDRESYQALHKIKALSETKIKHLQQMYKDFIPRDCCLPFITLP